MTTEGYLYDTCAFLYLAQDAKVSEEALEVLSGFGASERRLFVSAFTAWEIGMLNAKGRFNLAIPPLEWFAKTAVRLRAEVLEATPSILVAASFLPPPMHNDPADRILVATAREHDLTIITRDRAVLAYGAAGHVKVLAC